MGRLENNGSHGFSSDFAGCRGHGKARVFRIQLTKHWVKALGSSRENTRPKVSWEGTPLGNSRNCRNQSRRFLQNMAISTQESQPAITPPRAMTIMSTNLCRVLRRTRGSRERFKVIFQRRGLFEFVHRQPPRFGLEITELGGQRFLQKSGTKTCDYPDPISLSDPRVHGIG